MTEGRRLQRIGWAARDPVKLRRAIVVLMAARDQSVPDIANLLNCSPEYVRGMIHAFNDIGFGALRRLQLLLVATILASPYAGWASGNSHS